MRLSMKHILCLLLTFSLLLCGFSALAEDAASAGNGWTVTKEYSWSDAFGSYFAVAVKNTSDCPREVRCNADFLDKDGNSVGTASDSVAMLDPGYEALLYIVAPAEYDHVDYSVEYPESIYPEMDCHDIHSYVSVTGRVAGHKVILTGKNCGNVDAEFVKYHCIFLDEAGNPMDYQFGYLSDSDEMLKSGTVLWDEETSRMNFTSVDVYYEGRTDYDVVNTATVDVLPAMTVDGCEVVSEYTWFDDYDYNILIALKNTSGSACGYECRICFCDADDNVIAVDDDDIRGCDAGADTFFNFYTDEPFDHVRYSITKTEADYADIHASVEMTATVDTEDEKILLAATNNGTVNAEYVEYCILLLDAEGTVTEVDSGYIVDSDSVIKPGNTETRNYWYEAPFDSVQIWFTGRAAKPDAE